MSFKRWLKKFLTLRIIGDNIITMTIQDALKELVNRRGLRKVARDLGITHSSLYKSIQDGSNVGLDRIEAILNLFGLELKAVKKKGMNTTNFSGHRHSRKGRLNGNDRP